MPSLGCEWNEIDWVVAAAETPGTNHFRRFEDWYLWNQLQKSSEAETRKVSSIRTQLGWSSGKLFKRIASMPLHLYMILHRIDPEFGRNTKEGRAKMYRFVQRHPEFSVRET